MKYKLLYHYSFYNIVLILQHVKFNSLDVLLSAQGHIKLTDFGTSTICNDENSTNNSPRTSFVGTQDYVSPEVLSGDRKATKACDLWALGCMIYQMLSGISPFRAGTEYLTFECIMGHCRGTKPLVFPSVIDEVSQDLIMKLLHPIDTERIGAGSDLIDDCTPPPHTTTTSNSSSYSSVGNSSSSDSNNMSINTSSNIAVEVIYGTDSSTSSSIDTTTASGLVLSKPPTAMNNNSSSSNGYKALKSHPFFTNIQWGKLDSLPPPYQPDPSTFPQDNNMRDGSSDEWLFDDPSPMMSCDSTSAKEYSNNNNIPKKQSPHHHPSNSSVSTIDCSSSNNNSSISFSRLSTNSVTLWDHFLVGKERQLFTGLIYKRKVKNIYISLNTVYCFLLLSLLMIWILIIFVLK